MSRAIDIWVKPIGENFIAVSTMVDGKLSDAYVMDIERLTMREAALEVLQACVNHHPDRLPLCVDLKPTSDRSAQAGDE